VHVNLIARRRAVSQNLEEKPPFAAAAEPGAPMFELIELMFFAYRDFVGDADHLLVTLGFGRAHHRALHFVSRRPGLTIAELLDILKITKQSLNRVLKELFARDYVEARPDMKDRRQRQLCSNRARTGYCAGTRPVTVETVCACVRGASGGGSARAIDFLRAMVDTGGRDKVATMTGAGPASGQRR
jgi:DNA-binding transcriptional ArsR family regulator